MMKKKLTAIALAATMCVAGVSLAGCGAKKGEGELWITYYNGGYGSDWVEQLGAKFSEKTGIPVRTDADTQLIDSVANMMENGTNYDLIFCHDVAWEDFVAPGYIYNLDALYATQVEYKGETVTYADRIWDEDVLASASYNGHYYKVPWTIGTAGIAYSLTIMDRIDAWLATAKGQEYLNKREGHLTTKEANTARRWKRQAPKDYYELIQYCYDIENAKLEVNEDAPKDEKVKAFCWSGGAEEWQWDYVVFDWWGQLAGPETMNTFKNFANVKEDFTLDIANQKNPNSDVYNPSLMAKDNNNIGWGEFQQAYKLWYNMVVADGTTELKKWSTNDTAGLSKFDNENAFASYRAAMTPAACWVEYETSYYLNKTHNEISLMPTPTISNVKFDASGKLLFPCDAAYDSATAALDAIHADPNATEKVIEVNGTKYNRVSFTSSFGDSAMIPAKSTGRDLAVQFLLFMQEEENAKLFTKLAHGTILPYKYDYASSFIDENGIDQASAWQKSIFEIDQNSTKFNNYTQHPMMRSTQLKGSARMTSVWPNNKYYYLNAWKEPTNTAYQPTTLIPNIYQNDVLKLWETYKKLL
ncbi:MAG: hypothetical protein HDP34_04950 [Clostridia bacterium]|nr:hypothetical protein [Clostridia bacterium]